MARELTSPSNANIQIDISTLDLTSQVGKDIIIFSEQFHGKPLKSRITAISENTLSIDRGGNGGMIDNLVHNQIVTARIDYKGEPLSLRAQLKRNQGGKCILHLGEKVVPLARRRFVRVQTDGSARFAVCPVTNFDQARMNRLRWLETPVKNVSSGGTRISLSTPIEQGTFLFLNILAETVELPMLLLGVVRHCHRDAGSEYSIGIEFIVQEDKNSHFSSTVSRRLPTVVFEYTAADRSAENRRLATWMKNQDSME